MRQNTDKLPIQELQAMEDKAPRREQNSLDDGFVNAYCERPMDGKTAALITAGFVGDNIPQEAYRMFKRLLPQIKKRTDDLINTLDALAASQLEGILKSKVDEVGYSNMNTAIKQGMDYAGRKPGDTLTIVKTQTIDDLNGEISNLHKETAEAEGKTIDQVMKELIH